MEAMRVLVILFLVTVGRTPADRHEFDRIKGEWRIVGSEVHGDRSTRDRWKGKKLIVSRPIGAVRQPAESLAYIGRLETRTKPPRMVISFVRSAGPPRQAEATGAEPPDVHKPASRISSIHPAEEAKYITTYEVRGDKMKLYMMEFYGKASPLPKKPGFAPGAHGILFRLERTPDRGGRQRQ